MMISFAINISKFSFKLKDSIGWIINKFKYTSTIQNDKYPPDFSPEDIEIIETVAPYTMTTPERIYALVRAVEYIVSAQVAGDIVECGVWRGGSMLAVSKTLLRLGDTSRRLFLYDTFEGMTQSTSLDRNFRGDSAAEIMSREPKETSLVWAVSSFEAVENLMKNAAYPGVISCIKGKVEETIPSCAPDKIALLRLDTDWYESTYHELLHLFPRITSGGVLIVDDYGHWEGARRAVDQYFVETGTQILLNRIDYTGRIAVKR
jgi:hypothetical protein